MPRAIPSIPDPTATTEGLQLTVKRRASGGADLILYYPPDPDGPYIQPASVLTPTQRTALNDIVAAMIAGLKAARGYV